VKLKQCCHEPNIQLQKGEILDFTEGYSYQGNYLKCLACGRKSEGFKPMDNGLPDLPSLERDWNK
jgi:hypothetical protein